jgi:hypothetical protein
MILYLYMPKEKYTKEIIAETIKKSRSFRDLTIKLGAGSHGGAIQSITKKVINYGLDTSHFKGKSWYKGEASNKKLTAIDILVYGKERQSSILKRALLEIGVEFKCSVCNIVEWMGQVLSLQIDHKDGDRKNNKEENIRFICPNCHSQTKTYCFNGRKHK